MLENHVLQLFIYILEEAYVEARSHEWPSLLRLQRKTLHDSSRKHQILLNGYRVPPSPNSISSL